MEEKKKKNKLSLIGKVVYWLILISLILVAGVTAGSLIDIPGNYKLLTVQSGSMEPAIKMGSVVAVKPFGEYHKGEVITFTADPKNPQDSVTHRVLEIKEDGKEFVTKGDANKTPDPKAVLKNQVLGKVILIVPYLGYPINFAKTPEGLVLLVIIPAVLIVYSELKKVKEELLLMKDRIKKKKK